MSSLYYLNGGFDIGLSGGSTMRYQEQIAQMTSWFIPLGEPSDQVLVAVAVPDEYKQYLESIGISSASCVSSGSGKTGDLRVYERYCIWGWDRETCELFTSLELFPEHPPLETVRRVNSKEFSSLLAEKHGLGVPDSKRVYSFTELRSVLARSDDYPMIVKPFFGNAGIGFVSVSKGPLSGGKENRLKAMFQRGQKGVVVEPWLDKIEDWGTSFNLDSEGTVSDVKSYRTITTSQGAFYGLYCSPSLKLDIKYKTVMRAAVNHIADELHGTGYFGPVNIDSILYRKKDSGEIALVPVLEINARYSMSTIACGVMKKMPPGKEGLFRTVGRKQNTLSHTYGELEQQLGELAYTASRERGVIVTSPLWFGHRDSPVLPYRTILLVIGDSIKEIQEIDSALTEKIRTV